jgi:hypothetical protein
VRTKKIIGYQGYPRAIAMENLFCLISSPGEEDLFSNTREPRLDQGFFSSSHKAFLKSRVVIHCRNDFSTFSARPAIKDDINFFLDFDFQPLYTFINCGFLLRTAHP